MSTFSEPTTPTLSDIQAQLNRMEGKLDTLLKEEEQELKQTQTGSFGSVEQSK